MAWISSLFQRRIVHYFNDAVTVKQVLSEKGGNNRVTEAWFEKLRVGGDGAGAITLNDAFSSRNDVQIGDWISMEFDSDTRWYFGRVESVDHSSPKGAVVNLEGMWAELGEVFPGSFANAGQGKPHRFANSDYFPNDPDHTFQTVDTVGQPESVVRLLYDRYAAAKTHVTIGSIESPVILSGFESMVVRGEESVAELYRRLAAEARMMSVGVNQYGQLYFINRRFTTIAYYQEGVNVKNLVQVQDRSLLFNRVLLTGGYIYGGTPNPYRQRWNFIHNPSASLHGERVIEIFAPEIRRNHDAVNFVTFFFSQFAQATTRFSFRAEFDGTFPLPHLGWIRLLDKDANLIANGQFDRIRVQFDHKPIFDITLGPEDLQFPNAPENQRWEIPNPDDQGDGEDPPEESQSSRDSTFVDSSARSSAFQSSARSSVLEESRRSSAQSSDDIVSSALSSARASSAASSDAIASSALSSDAIVSSAESSRLASSALSSDDLASSALSSARASSAASSAAVSSAASSAAVSSAASSDAIASSGASSDAIASSADSSVRKSSADSSDRIASSADSSARRSSAESSDRLASSALSSARLSSARSSSALSSARSSSAASSEKLATSVSEVEP